MTLALNRDTKCCGKRGNSDANVGGGEHGEEVVRAHGGWSCDHYIQDGAIPKRKSHKGSKRGQKTRCEKLLAWNSSQEESWEVELPVDRMAIAQPEVKWYSPYMVPAVIHFIESKLLSVRYSDNCSNYYTSCSPYRLR